MRLFFLLFVLIYASMHFYAMTAASSVFNLKLGSRVCIAFIMLALTLFPFIVRYLEKTGHQSSAIIAAYTGYYWMGFLLYLVLSLLSFDLFRMLLYVVSRVGFHTPESMNIKITRSFYASVVVSICICIYGYFEARSIRIERIVVRTNKVTSKIKIAQITDAHIGLIIREKRIKSIVEAIAAIKPDILVSTGDFVDGQLDISGDINAYAAPFKELNPPLGKFAVTGNHEFYAGLSQPLDFTQLCGFKVLRNEGVEIGNSIVIAGVDDREADNLLWRRHRRTSQNDKGSGNAEETCRSKEIKLLTGIPDDKFTILLKHRPELNRPEDRLFDLQLSGHTHKGQLFPFSILTWLYYSKQTGLSDLATWVYIPNRSGLVTVGQRGLMYVNRGVGTWGPPIRVLSPPEIAIIEIVPDDGKHRDSCVLPKEDVIA